MANPSPSPKDRWKPGQVVNKHGNPFLAYANAFRGNLWTASTPERRIALSELLWAYALGKVTVPVEKDGIPILDPDGSPRVKTLPPQPWAIEVLLDRLMGSVSFKSIEANVTVDVSDTTERARQVARVLVEEGMGDRLPEPMRALLEQSSECVDARKSD